MPRWIDVEKRRALILRLHSEGKRNKDIAIKTGYSPHHVSQFLKEQGLRSNGNIRKPVQRVGDRIVCSKCGNPGEIYGYHTWTRRDGSVRRYPKGVCKKCTHERIKAAQSKNTFKYRVYGIRTRARAEQIPCDITEQDLLALWEAQCGKCFYTDRDMVLGVGGTGWQKNKDAVSVDKIVPRIGYVVGNIVLCTNRANKIKNDLSLDEMKAWMPGWYDRLYTLFWNQLLPKGEVAA